MEAISSALGLLFLAFVVLVVGRFHLEGDRAAGRVVCVVDVGGERVCLLMRVGV